MKNTISSKTSLPSPEDALEWAREATRKNEMNKASERWLIILQAFPNNPSVLFGAIDFYLKTDDINNANRLYENAQAAFPKHPNIFLQGAQIAQKQGDIQRTKEFLEAARRDHPDKLETWLQSTAFALSQALYEEAEAYNQKARQLFSEQPHPHKQYAEIAMQQNDWQTALKRWEAFRKKFPEHPAGYLLAAEAAEKSGNNRLARKLKLAREYGEEILTETEPTDNTSFHNRRHHHATWSGLTELIWTKAIFNLRSETERSYLSYVWWILEPLLYVVVFYFVFGSLLQRGGEGFTVFLLTGLIPWMWFNKTIINSSNSLIAGKNLMLNVNIPSIFFPLVMIIQSTLKQIPIFFILIVFVWALGSSPELHWFYLFPVIFVQLLMTICIGGGLAALIPFIRDIAFLVPTGLTFLMFLSGVFFDYQQLPLEWHNLFLMNPIAFLLKCYRDILLEGSPPDLFLLSLWAILFIIGCSFTFWLYRKLRYVFPKIVMS